ncbi:MAG: hypothetical protein K6G26_12165, partial [Lachnospiraceae bacterium]|nr:hypothetical protein [Lachnospiraceae bacterium]
MKRLLKICFTMSLAVFMFTGCKSLESNPVNNGPVETVVPSRFEKESLIDKEDGWIYTLNLTQSMDKDGSDSYHFDGYNLKHSTMDGFSGSSSINRFNSVADSIPMLSNSSEYLNDVKNISEFFTEKNFTKAITDKDLAELELTKIDKTDIVVLFNALLKEDYKDVTHNETEYINLPYAGIEKRSIEDKESVIFSYYYTMNTFMRVNLDIEYTDGTFLSDAIANGTATDEQKLLYENLDKISKYILQEQSIVTKDVFDNLEGAEYSV